MRQRCGQDERKHLRDRVSPPRTTPGTQSDHWGNCPSALSADLDHLAPRGPLRGTRPGRVQKVEANTHCKNDPAAPKPRLPRRTAHCSTQPNMRPGRAAGFSTLPTTPRISPSMNTRASVGKRQQSSDLPSLKAPDLIATRYTRMRIGEDFSSQLARLSE